MYLIYLKIIYLGKYSFEIFFTIIFLVIKIKTTILHGNFNHKVYAFNYFCNFIN